PAAQARWGAYGDAVMRPAWRGRCEGGRRAAAPMHAWRYVRTSSANWHSMHWVRSLRRCTRTSARVTAVSRVPNAHDQAPDTRRAAPRPVWGASRFSAVRAPAAIGGTV